MTNLQQLATWLLVGLFFCTVQVATQNVTTARPERAEYEGFTFLYDHVTQTFLVRNTGQNACYIWTLTKDELASIHTDGGLTNVELRVIKEIDDAFYTVIPRNILSRSIPGNCGFNNADMKFYIVH